MSQRFGLQARYLMAMVATLAVVLVLVGVLLQRQATLQREVGALGRQAMESMATDALVRRGRAMATQLSDVLVNPLYFSDLDAIGDIVRTASREPDVAYILVYDEKGRIVHDGSEDMAAYGQPMTGPLAAAASNAMLTQSSDEFMDVSQAITIGGRRIGGVRLGFSLSEVRARGDRAAADLKSQLSDAGRRHMGWIALLLGALMAVGAISALYIQRTLVRPIRQLVEAANDIGVRSYDPRHLASDRTDEVGELVRTFGSMNDSIARHDHDVRRMAHTDALTGLTNQLAFRESLDRRLMLLRGTGGRLALLFADIDDFKRINDTLGHEAGDEVLLQFANRIAGVVGAIGGHDALLGRFGGDEFVILIQEGDVRAAGTQLAEALVKELEQPAVVQGRQVFLGASIGITLFPEDASSASALMKNGDIAMYQAKVAGKNCYRFYSRAMDQAVERRVHMEQELRGAWERGELSLVYQPVMRLADQRIVGAEALLRWQHPELGSIAPSMFIDVAEQSGLIEKLGPRVLRAACAAAAGWDTTADGQEPPFVSVNVSPRQLRTGDLPEMVADSLRETGLPPSRLHLELTETAIIGDEAQASALLARLHRTGVKVWLDDFGTGFSGLSHLRRVPVDGVKID
ncbi:MAG TPA: EAL domain-containing protein, partial [Pseudoxanthomonas sp.]|nr:EAL domain-containing protein [Pseudoxanthomonas sp.]